MLLKRAGLFGLFIWVKGYFLMTLSVGAEQVLGALNAYEKDLPCEYHYSLFKCFESAQRTTDAELGE